MNFFAKKKVFFLIVAGIIGAAILRFYNLNWGAPFYFHPDERNIVSSVVQLNFPNQMNPHFFAYGSFPIYLIYFSGIVLDLFLESQDLFAQAVLISRSYSAALSLLLIPSTYFIGKKMASKEVGFLAAALSIFSVGFVQFAHFGTVEMWLTFFGIWLFYFSLKLIKDLNFKNIFIIGTIFGFLMATKVSSLLLLALPLATILLNLLSRVRKRKAHLLLPEISLNTLILIFISLIIFAVFSPYVFLDFKSFLSGMQYESSVALGTLPVFYTGEFFNSVPILFQFTKIYPFLINPLLTILFLPSFVYVLVTGIKKMNYSYLLLTAGYLMLFLPQAFLFAKWTRYMVPTLPFIYLIISITLIDLLKRKYSNLKYFILSIVIVISLIHTTSYFITAFVKTDTRIEASRWAKENMKNTDIVSEVYDLGLVAFNPFFNRITMFNFYDLDNAGVAKIEEAYFLLQKSEYIIIPSNRIMKTRIVDAGQFPIGHEFYTSLFNGELGYTKIYETPCDIFCKITYLNNPIFSFEYTANVFDRPTVIIFKKI